MSEVRFDAPCIGALYLKGGAVNHGYDYLVRGNCGRDKLDLLVFFDSRGIGASFDDSLANRIMSHAKVGRYLMICRPLNLTTWATLCNFLLLNDLRPKKIITNMGFVDFTPKKQSVLEDAIKQVETLIGPNVAAYSFVENYAVSSGTMKPLYAMRYSNAYADKINHALRNCETFVINTPTLSRDIRIERERPKSFFSMIDKSNHFNRSLQVKHVFDFSCFDEDQTYDGVHYTSLGSEMIFREIQGVL